ncbi:hypothetical protein PSPO01_08062 [Paraphaeosphaeria sporulosa]
MTSRATSVSVRSYLGIFLPKISVLLGFAMDTEYFQIDVSYMSRSSEIEAYCIPARLAGGTVVETVRLPFVDDFMPPGGAVRRHDPTKCHAETKPLA